MLSFSVIEIQILLHSKFIPDLNVELSTLLLLISVKLLLD